MINRARSVAAQAIAPAGPASTAPVPVATAARPERIARQEWPQDELASMYASIALRDLNLVDSLLARLEGMEANENDPEALSRLYRLDHLATRLRRNAENLRILAGQDVGSAATEPCSLVDVLRAAMSSIDQYTRVEIGRVTALAVVDFAADDVSRLLAELLDNATTQSPPTSIVTVSAHLTEQGSVLVRVEDAGIGLPTERLRALNARLSTNTRLDGEAIEHMGLAVVRLLANKHGMRVTLEQRPTHGTTASVLLPSSLLCEAPPTPWFTEVPATQSRYHAPAHLTRPATPSTAPLPSRRSAPAPSEGPPSGAATPGPPGPASVTPEARTPEARTPETRAPGTGAPETGAPGTGAPGTSAPEAQVPEARAATGTADRTATPLPEQGAAGESEAGHGPTDALSSTGRHAAWTPAVQSAAAEHAASSTTRNGLPRRVPRSLRSPEEVSASTASAATSGASRAPSGAQGADVDDAELRAGRRQFVADLGDFSDGEQAARVDVPADAHADTRPDVPDDPPGDESDDAPSEGSTS